ncbi:MAG: hypothetical protein FH749_14790 [Firmicutes bacterium]|nr:hypothetical protein [Bacillota bacterium]
MERICPVCNGLQGARRFCPYCGGNLEDRGALQEFVDDYSPYLSQQLGEDLSGGDECVHLYYCPRCQEDVRLRITMWTL